MICPSTCGMMTAESRDFKGGDVVGGVVDGNGLAVFDFDGSGPAACCVASDFLPQLEPIKQRTPKP